MRLLVALLLFTSPQFETGVVRIQTLPGVEIRWEGLRIGSTDAAGELRIEDIPPGSYSVTLSMSGYREQTRRVQVAPGVASLVVRLEPTASAAATEPSEQRADGGDSTKSPKRSDTVDRSGASAERSPLRPDPPPALPPKGDGSSQPAPAVPQSPFAEASAPASTGVGSAAARAGESPVRRVHGGWLGALTLLATVGALSATAATIYRRRSAGRRAPYGGTSLLPHPEPADMLELKTSPGEKPVAGQEATFIDELKRRERAERDAGANPRRSRRGSSCDAPTPEDVIDAQYREVAEPDEPS